MGNEVANPFGASAALTDRKAMAQRAAESASDGARGGAPDGSDYMNFSGKRGLYTIGQDKRRIEADELWVLNIASFEDGYVCWKGGKPAGQRMANIFTGTKVQAPDPEEGGPFNTSNGEGWHKAKAWVSKSLDNDQQGYFKVNSVSGVGEMADMLDEVSKRMATGQACWPVFHYDMEEFESKGHKNFKPIFKIYGWLDDEAMGKLDDEIDIDTLIEQSSVAEMLPNNSGDDKGGKGSDPAPTAEKAPAQRRRRRAS